MTYFDLFQLKPSLQINKTELKKTYYQLSKAFHPDLHNSTSDMDFEKKTIEINTAYKVLNNENLLIKYILEENNFWQENDKTPLPAHFLMEMMELNEEKMELNTEEEQTIFHKKIALVQNENRKTIATLFAKENIETLNAEELNVLKNYYLQNKYLEKLK